MTRTAVRDQDFIFDRVEQDDRGCWIWQGSRGGRPNDLRARYDNEYAYRISYRVFVGEIPEGLSICHHCDNGLCVNPDHIYAGTHAQNMRDMGDRGRYRLPGLKGDEHPRALPRDLVEKVRADYTTGRYTILQVAELHGLSPFTVEKWTGGDVRDLEPIRIRSGRFESTNPECGTRAKIYVHRRRGEPVCEACKEADRAYMREWKARRRLREAS